jgi:signal transduction histidine kinase/CheY-like chemotaxis protein/HAMP domain-containing protein
MVMTNLRIARPREVFDDREILRALRAFQSGDFSVRMPLHLTGVYGEIAETFNDVVRMSEALAGEIARIRDQVDKEGKINQRVSVSAAGGAWLACVNSVNTLIGDLVRPIFEAAVVIDAVAKGDLTRSITVDAQGEIAVLRDKINEMIRNLAETRRKNTEQDWVKTHLATFTRTLQCHRDLVAVSQLILTELTPLVNAQRGVVYACNVENDKPGFIALATYPREPDNNAPREPHVQENLIERCAFERKRILLNDWTVEPEPGAHAAPSVIIMPVLFEGEVKAVIELASFKRFSETHLSFLEQLTGSIGVVFNTIDATMRTERQLAQSQSLAKELQDQQEELRRTNRRLTQNAGQLYEQMKQLKYKNSEVELARAALEEKVEQLALNSRYKTEFLANMSHELRTPLNSLLILAQLLAENPASNLTPRQVEFAQTIYAAGKDLLALINDVLDLAKVESGTVALHIANERFEELRDYLNGAFRQLGNDKGLQFRISIAPDLPPTMCTDAKRLHQILKNLLSNALKFTAEGTVSLEVTMAGAGWTPHHPVLAEAAKVVAFSVIDTGIGIAPDKQQIIFDAFQQADGTTSRNYGGTGLGLSISARLSHLLGGEIKVQSKPGVGSTFTLYLPLVQSAEGENAPLENIVGVPAADPSGVSVERASRPEQVPVSKQAAFAQPAAEEPTPYMQDAARDAQSLIRPAPAGSARVITELSGRKVLLVDDDIRNIFALSSALERQGMIVINTENGLDAITVLRNHPHIDIILIDMMMPEMDGYDTIRAMRGSEHFTGVPIIGVSARAMKGDREKCIAAGASDYISKPVNVDHLLSLIRARLVK